MTRLSTKSPRRSRPSFRPSATAYPRKISAERKTSIGAIAVIWCVVLSQFSDLTIATIGDFVISAQKLAAVAVLPLGLIAMRRIAFPPAIVGPGTVLLVGFLAAPLCGTGPSGGVVGSVLALTLAVGAACILYSALCEGTDGLQHLRKAWVFGAVITGAVAVGQAFDFVPLFAVSADALDRRAVIAGLTRATGFKFDPNFAAMMLVVGLVFARYQSSGWRRRASVIIILLGTLATFSRMGLLAAAVALVLTVDWNESSKSQRVSLAVRRVAVAIGIAVVGIVVYNATTGAVHLYLEERIDDLRGGFYALTGGSGQSVVTGSALERADLFRASVDIIEKNWMLGVGPNHLQGMLYEAIGVDKGAHNTYLETIAIGGLAGIAAVLIYLNAVIGSLRAARRSATATADLRTVRCVGSVCLVAGLMASVLTLDYNMFVFIPLTLAAAAAQNTRAKSAAESRHA